MKKIFVILFYLITSFGLIFHCTKQDNIKITVEDYLGQKPPGLTPKKFAPDIISTESNELNCVFTPDGRECFFSIWEEGINTIMTIKKKNGQWTKRSVASFSGVYSDVDPYITSDGKRLYFSSKRPLDGNGKPKDSDIWYVEKNSNNKWDSLTHLGIINAKGKDDYYTSITKDGSLYYSIFETHGSPGDIYRSNLVDGVYTKSELIDYKISTKFNEHDPFIAPDESYLIFTSDRPAGFGRGDLYISFKKSNGAWAEPKNMGETINSDGYDFCPMLSPDGHYLFFTRNIKGNGDIYWVSSKIIDSFKLDN
jgi:Tol biopolymer transport system component